MSAPNYSKIVSEAKIALLWKVGNLISAASAARWAETNHDIHKQWTLEAIADARTSLDEIEALLSATDEAEAA